ncbi:hypothetical protein K1T71_000437 [Dendrolimus kikuchii]|uniref:Uncharacterized protein n=1 Tax=Dendrolimus kikuchii TaxID=765133 RepID=A0ACC1DJV4_9NEOP|nr:hypothetical protein K1T71_000437 [Dendrolimus kikuchii]
MPCLKILTNLSSSNVPSDFVNNIIPLLSKVVNKPPQKFTCIISSDCQLSFGGNSSEPGAVASLESIGHLGPKENKLIAKEVTEFVQKELGIPSSRFFLSFYDLQPNNVAIKGDTVA